MSKRKDATSQETTELCGQPLDSKDPTSPRCAIEKNNHAGRQHQALKPGGGTVEWPVEPDRF
jgi:hypothetical protein